MSRMRCFLRAIVCATPALIALSPSSAAAEPTFGGSGLRPGVAVEVREKHPFDGPLVLRVVHGLGLAGHRLHGRPVDQRLGAGLEQVQLTCTAAGSVPALTTDLSSLPTQCIGATSGPTAPPADINFAGAGVSVASDGESTLGIFYERDY